MNVDAHDLSDSRTGMTEQEAPTLETLAKRISLIEYNAECSAKTFDQAIAALAAATLCIQNSWTVIQKQQGEIDDLRKQLSELAPLTPAAEGVGK